MLMKIFTKITAALLLLVGAVSANAASLGEGRIINPNPPEGLHTSLLQVTLTYNFALIKIADYDMAVLVTMGGKTFEVYPDIYFDEEVALELGQTNDDPEWGNELTIPFSEEAFSLGYPVGPYEIIVPEGIVEDASGNTNPEQTITLIKVKAEAPVSVTPADGMHAEITDAVITFDKPLTLNPNRERIELREKNDWLSTPYYVENYSISEDGMSLVLDLDGLLKRGVLYTVWVPEGFVQLDEYYVNSEVWMEYMYWNGMEAATIISAPEHETDADIPPFILTWDYQTISFAKDAPDTEFVCGFPDFGGKDGWRIFIPASYYELKHVNQDGTYTDPTEALPANALYIDVKEFTEDYPGYQFEIFFPAGLVVNAEGLDNPPLQYTFTVREIWPAPQVTIDAGIIEILWPRAENASYGLSDNDPTLTSEAGENYDLRFTFGGTQPGEVSLINEGTTSGKHGLVIDLSGLDLADGLYTLIVPQGYLYLGGIYGDFVMNGKVTYQFTLKDGQFAEYDSVTLIPAADGLLNIYDLNGRLVKKDTTLEGLSKGIYIVNGVKVVKSLSR